MITTLVRGDQRVAVVSHATDVPEIESAMGAAFTLALDNERLQAEGLAQLEELRASRSRIVETGDLERQRLERDLHDGAQQRLLAASYEIRLARSSAALRGRRTHGSHPLALPSEGTRPRSTSSGSSRTGSTRRSSGRPGLLRRSRPWRTRRRWLVDTEGSTEERYSAAIEVAAYQLVVDGVEDAAARPPS